MGRFFCNKCGRVFTDAYAPNICPFCQSDRADFLRVKEDMTQTIPDYWNEELDEKILKIRNLQIAAGEQSASFGLITDIHWCDNAHHSAAIMEKVLDKCSIPYFFNAGDIISGFGICGKDFLFEELDSYREAFKKIENKCLVALGNHDMAYSTLEAPNYYAENLSRDEIYEYFFRWETLYPSRVFGPDMSYYYADDEYHKMRYVVLNTHDVPTEELGENGLPLYNKFTEQLFGKVQLDWFINVALCVPSSDWTVTLCTHENLVDGWKIAGSELVLGILNAFKNHDKFEGETFIEAYGEKISVSADFVGKGGNFTAWVSGHTHCDFMEVIDGITCVATLNDSIHKSGKAEFEKFRRTTNEHAFDIFTVDKRSRKVHITRIGAGRDREFNY